MNAKCLFFAVACGAALTLSALPEGCRAVSGEAICERTGAESLHVSTSHRSILEWDSFSIATGEWTHFAMPSASSAVLNRVMSDIPSEIFGTLTSNGIVWLVNPNGVFVGENGRIETAAFLASSFDVLNESFLEGREGAFQGNSDAEVVNLGTIRAACGDVALIAKIVRQKGTIETPQGEIVMAAGKDLLLKIDGPDRIWIQPDPTAQENLQSDLQANGNAYAFAIHSSGRVQANRIEEIGGRIYLVAPQGTVQVEGTLQAESGRIEIFGDQIGLLEGAEINVSGPNGGGTILVGGDFQGEEGSAPNASVIWVDRGALLKADARVKGDGGKVILWSEKGTGCFGTISARGGERGGNGGLVEISSRDYLDFQGKADTLAPQGLSGELLLDPTEVTISPSPDANHSFAKGAYAFSAVSSVISTSTLASNLQTGHVTIDAHNGYRGSGDIILAAGATLSWSQPTSLTLIAARDIVLADTIKNDSLTSSGSLPQVNLMADRDIYIGNGANIGQIAVHDMNVALSAGRDIYIRGSNAASGEGKIQLLVGDLNITATRHLILEGGNQPFSRAWIESNTRVGSVNITSGGDCILASGGGLESFASIRGGPTETSQFNLNVRGNLILRGNRSTASVLTHDGQNTLNVTGDVQLTSSDIKGGAVIVGTTGDGSCVVHVGGDATLDASGADVAEIRSHSGSTYVAVAGDLTVVSGDQASATVDCGGGDLNVVVGGDINLYSEGTEKTKIDNHTIMAEGGNVTLISGKNLKIDEGTEVTTQYGDVTLVIDNAHPSAPDFGMSQLSIDAGAAVIATGGNVNIFSVNEELNQIEGMVMAVPFQSEVTSDMPSMEMWDVYFPPDMLPPDPAAIAVEQNPITPEMPIEISPMEIEMPVAVDASFMEQPMEMPVAVDASFMEQPMEMPIAIDASFIEQPIEMVETPIAAVDAPAEKLPVTLSLPPFRQGLSVGSIFYYYKVSTPAFSRAKASISDQLSVANAQLSDMLPMKSLDAVFLIPVPDEFRLDNIYRAKKCEKMANRKFYECENW